MINITQGHETGIGLEVFFKSLPSFTQNDIDQFHLFADPQTISNQLKFITDKFQLDQNNISVYNRQIKYTPLKKNEYSQSMNSMLQAIESTNFSDILFTLPTSKDQLQFKNVNFAGHTEFLRFFFDNPLLTMSFWGPSHNQLLLTDHIPLSKVCATLTPEYFEQKLDLGITNYLHYFPETQHIYLAGINPHAGENGILGEEEINLQKALTNLQQKFPQLSNFIPGDTLHTYSSKYALFIYMYHDQGLARFKSENKFIGINATLGLPFVRLSVDHGTAFSLYGKNTANPQGAIYTLQAALKL